MVIPVNRASRLKTGQVDLGCRSDDEILLDHARADSRTNIARLNVLVNATMASGEVVVNVLKAKKGS